MFNGFKIGDAVIVHGPGEINGTFYENQSATIIRRDPYFLDYNVKFRDGTEDWILPRYLRKNLLEEEKKE